MGASKNTQSTKTNGTQTTTTPGTATGEALLPQVGTLANNVMGQSAFTGPRVAAPGQAQQVAQPGPAPSTFVPQVTATQDPTQALHTFVPTHDDNTISAGISAAQGTQAAQAPLIGQAYNDVGNILSGPNNQYVNNQIQALTTSHNQDVATTGNKIGQSFGANGAYGGLNMAKAQAFNNQALAVPFDNSVANLEAENYNQWQNFLQGAPGLIQGLGQATQAPIQSQGQWTDQRQQNLQEAAATGDANAQVLLNNLNQAQKLNDTNAVAKAQDDIAKWQAAYGASQASAQQTNANTAQSQQVDQAAMDNAYMAWLSGQQLTAEQTSILAQLMGISAGVPGSTTVGNSTSTSTQSQQAAPWQIAAGLGGAALQAMGGNPIGAISSLTASTLPNQSATPQQIAAQNPTNIPMFNPAQFSDRRLKTEIEPIVAVPGWYKFRYKWDPKGTIRVGVMADEVDPKFVTKDRSGYSMVNYNAMLGIA